LPPAFTARGIIMSYKYVWGYGLSCCMFF
jgi:hypothetical protein